MATYPLPTLAPTITSAGISIPSYNDIYQSLVVIFQTIYGSDIYVEPDSQDGQWLAALASAINNTNQACVAVFQSFSPQYSQGTQLSSLVKINGLRRQVPTNSQAVGNVVGQVGTIINNGSVLDVNGKQWNLPASVTIPIAGSIAVTVTAAQPGAIAAGIGDINVVNTPQLGWQTFANTSAATTGSPVEVDGALVYRQSISTSLPALGIIESISANVANVPGVSRSLIYENAGGDTDSNGVPGHSIAPIVEGGVVSAIAAAIALAKPPGIQTYGDTSITITDSLGLPRIINLFELANVPIYYVVTIKALAGYVSTTGDALIAALIAFTNSLPIGSDVYASQAAAVASLGGALGATFYIAHFYLGTSPAPVGVDNITIAFNQAANCVAGNVGVIPT